MNSAESTPWTLTPGHPTNKTKLDGGVVSVPLHGVIARYMCIEDHKHFAAAIRTVLPAGPTELSGFASLTRSHLAPQDTLHSVIRCEDGSHGLFDLSFALPRNAKRVFDLTVIGSEGMLYILDKTKDGKGAWKVIVHSAEGKEEAIAWEEKCGVLKELQYFADLLDGRDSGKGLPRNALLDVAVIQASLTSEGNTVDLLKLVGGH